MNFRKVSLAAFFLLSLSARVSLLHATPVWSNFKIEHCYGATATSDSVAPTIYTTHPIWFFDLQSSAYGLMGGTPNGAQTRNLAPQPRTVISGAFGTTQALFHMDDAPGNGGTTLKDSSYGGTILYMYKALQRSGDPFGGKYLSYSVANSSSMITGLDGAFTVRPFSVEVWFRSPPAAWGTILSQCPSHVGGYNDCLRIMVDSTQGYFGFGNDAIQADAPSGVNMADGNWHNLVATYDYSSLTMTLYVDGNQMGTHSGTGCSYQNGGNTYLGVAQAIGGNHFTGDIDELRVVNYEHSATQVAANYFGQGGQPFSGVYRGYPTIANGTSTVANISYDLGNRGKAAFPYNPAPAVFAEDTSESVGSQGLSITYDDSDLALPPKPTLRSVGYSSATWDWSSYICNSINTTYTVIPTWASSFDLPSATSYAATTLTPNTRYGLSILATYLDAGGDGEKIGPSGQSPTAYVRTLAAPPTSAPDNISATGPTSVQITAHIRPNPDGTLCEVLAKQNGVYTAVSAYQATNEGSVLSVGALPKSSHYVFAMDCENDDSIIGGRGPDSAGDPPASFVSQPAAPTSFGGNAPADAPVHCPKTSISWGWGPVNMGSSYPAPSSANTPYQVSQINGDGSLGSVKCTPANGQASCVENGLLSGNGYSRVVQAQDSNPNGYPMFTQWSGTSTVATVSTTGDFTDAPTDLSAVSGSNFLTWNWSPPFNVCVSFEYDIYDAVSGSLLGKVGDRTVTGSYPAPTFNQTADAQSRPLGVNALYSVQAVAIDTVSVRSPLSPSASAYTVANPPTDLAVASVSTGSLLLQWDPANNPSYTRYEVSMSPVNDLGQLVSLSTLTYISNNYTQTRLQVNGLNAGSTYYFRVRAANGRAEDNFGGQLTGFAILASTVTMPQPPALTGVATATDTMSWSWNYVVGASGYKLVNDAGVPILDNPNTTQTSFSSSTFLPNTVCGAKIAAYNSHAGLGPYSAPVYAFTWATPPGTPGVVGVTSNTVSLSWDPNGNATYTFYEISLATDSAFGVVAATVSAMGTSAVIGGLFPDLDYYARLRAINGSQQGTKFVTAGSAHTNPDLYVTRSSVPASPYAIPSGLVGLWHLDESSGTWAGDASSWRNTGVLTCLDNPALCSAPDSTPTFTTDAPPGLGHAVTFSGMRGSLLSIPDAGQYDGFSGSITLSAWVKPAASAQPDGAGLVAKGLWGHESFGLDLASVSGAPRYRFRAKLNGGGTAVVVATTAVRTGQWDLVTGVFDGGAAADVALYINGIFAGSSTTGGLMRELSAEPVSMGNRKDASGGYNLGFSGVIDDLRLVNAALSAAGAADLYRSYIPTQLTPSGANSAVHLLLPPNAFTSAASIYISDDPIGHPLRVPYSLLAQALARVPTGQMLMPPSPTYPTLVEIVPTLDGVNYFNGPLGSSAVLSLPYADANGDGIIDGSNPPVPASKLQLYTLDASVLAWNLLPTTVDIVAKRVSAPVSHFSIFALFGATSYGQTMSDARVYPVPWKWNSSDKFGGPCLYFDGLPTSGSIRILTLSGEKVIDLNVSSTDTGKKCWDGRNTAGKAVASGVYFAQIKSTLGGDRVLKFAIEK